MPKVSKRKRTPKGPQTSREATGHRANVHPAVDYEDVPTLDCIVVNTSYPPPPPAAASPSPSSAPPAKRAKKEPQPEKAPEASARTLVPCTTQTRRPAANLPNGFSDASPKRQSSRAGSQLLQYPVELSVAPETEISNFIPQTSTEASPVPSSSDAGLEGSLVGDPARYEYTSPTIIQPEDTELEMDEELMDAQRAGNTTNALGPIAQACDHEDIQEDGNTTRLSAKSENMQSAAAEHGLHGQGVGALGPNHPLSSKSSFSEFLERQYIEGQLQEAHAVSRSMQAKVVQPEATETVNAGQLRKKLATDDHIALLSKHTENSEVPGHQGIEADSTKAISFLFGQIEATGPQDAEDPKSTKDKTPDAEGVGREEALVTSRKLISPEDIVRQSVEEGEQTSLDDLVPDQVVKNPASRSRSRSTSFSSFHSVPSSEEREPVRVFNVPERSIRSMYPRRGTRRTGHSTTK